jgi:hypothetical protein
MVVHPYDLPVPILLHKLAAKVVSITAFFNIEPFRIKRFHHHSSMFSMTPSCEIYDEASKVAIKIAGIPLFPGTMVKYAQVICIWKASVY